MNRRRFFREGLRELLKPLGNAIDPLERAAHQLGKLDKISDPPQVRPIAKRPPISVPLQIWLRPPGALEDTRFRETCSRCGQCEQVCPAKCIKIDSTGTNGDGAPYIDVDSMPCVVCSGLECMRTCPSGALVPTSLNEIDMGTAEWKPGSCIRASGEECTICVDQCPLGSTAIELKEGAIHVIEDGCIGCGVCQYYCPTQPKSIAIIPKAARSD